MTEVANLLLPTDHRLTTVRHYDAGPPVETIRPEETFATTKEEEWVSKKKTEVVNTKQIETRVKRQVVLEDGKVVEDSGPQVTTNTTEDSETQEHHQTELRKLGDDEKDAIAGASKSLDAIDGPRWVATSNPNGVVREVKERRVISREETEAVKETEDIQHLGDISDEAFLAAVNSGRKDIRSVLRSKTQEGALVSTGPRVVKDTHKSNKVTDTEETRELSSVQADGKIVTETQRTTEHEEVDDRELPKDQKDINLYKESSQRYFKAREQEDVDYYADGVKIGHEMRFKAETTEADRRGDGGLEDPDWDSLSARARRRTPRQYHHHRYRGLETNLAAQERKDALTRRPLDFDAEEETRKVETSKWLENHFGSESSSRESFAGDDDASPPKTSFFNVTIKSTPKRSESPAGGHKVQQQSATKGYFKGISEWSERRQEDFKSSPINDYRVLSASPTRTQTSPPVIQTPTPPQRKRASERQRQRTSQDSRYDSGYRTPTKLDKEEPEEPPPDYSPPSPLQSAERKQTQRTRFAETITRENVIKESQPKLKTGNIIGQSIRKLVGKIRSASAERKAKQRAKRSPSPPTYQAGHQIDRDIITVEKPVQRYYLGEDPFAGSIYGRENKYDGVKPARISRRHNKDHNRSDYYEERSQSSLGRQLSKSTSRLAASAPQESRFSQTLPRHATQKVPQINVSIVNNNVSDQKKKFQQLSRSKSFNEQPLSNMYRSNPSLGRINDNSSGLTSPALISSLSRSQRDLHEDSARFYEAQNYRGKDVYGRIPTFHDDDLDGFKTTSILKSTSKYGGDIYEPPTRLRDTQQPVVRRGSISSGDFSETYHTTKRNDDPLRPSITNTTHSVSKKTLPARDGRALETIESTETRSVTKSHYSRADPVSTSSLNRRYFDSVSPVVIEVKHYDSKN